MNACDGFLARLENAMLALACLAIVVIVSVTAADVAARYAFNAPFAWSHDLVTQYLLVAVFFLSLPYVTRVGGHMSLDYLARKVRNAALRNVLLLLGDALALVLVVGFIYGSYDVAALAFTGGDVLAGDLPLPTWPSRMLGPIGGSVLALRLAMRIAVSVRATVQGAPSPLLAANASAHVPAA